MIQTGFTRKTVYEYPLSLPKYFQNNCHEWNPGPVYISGQLTLVRKRIRASKFRPLKKALIEICAGFGVSLSIAVLFDQDQLKALTTCKGIPI